MKYSLSFDGNAKLMFSLIIDCKIGQLNHQMLKLCT